MVVRISSSPKAAVPSNGVPGMGFNIFIGIDFIFSSRKVIARSIRSSIDSPIPMIPPEQTSIPTSCAARIVLIFSSIV